MVGPRLESGSAEAEPVATVQELERFRSCLWWGILPVDEPLLTHFGRGGGRESREEVSLSAKRVYSQFSGYGQ